MTTASSKRALNAVLWGVLLALSGLPLAGADNGMLQRYEFTQVEMGVPFKLLLYAADKGAAKGASDAAFTRVRQLNAALSDYDADSELSRLSATAGSDSDVPVSDDLWQMLVRSQALAEQTGGAFDVTVGPYVRLWRRARRQKEMPGGERLAEAKRAVGYRHLLLDKKRQTARLVVPGMRLDLGGIAKGHAVDQALTVLRSRGIEHALLDASGDIGVLGSPPGKRGWSVGVVPLEADGSPSRPLLLSDAAVATSGDAFQFVEIGGVRYSHIVDPRTGLGLSQMSSVTVIAPDCVTADSLATAVSVMGPEAGLKLIERTEGAAAMIVVRRDNRIQTYESARFSEFEAKP